GEPQRQLCTEVPNVLQGLKGFGKATLAMPGVIALGAPAFTLQAKAAAEAAILDQQLEHKADELKGVAMIVLCDDPDFVSAKLNNYLWVTYTRCNPSHDIYGINPFTAHKHWGCEGPLVIDARIKPHHAPPVEKDPAVEKRIDAIFAKGGSLHGVLK
ncbi:MAG TPA: 3-octaprenyl-4-hydroxybenzoate carboxy-lyase, partial [Chitinophagaceae bacterium]|nr:3-octaprenyl-4-hydroxybenzoate carboxy-lyase [Chitinophagaceae bacterium]